MSRLNISYPFVFNALSGKQPATDLDDDFNAVPDGTVTIGARTKTGSYTLVADDEFSFFVCVPVANMTLGLPLAPSTDFSFFFSNQVTNKTVQLLGSVTVDGVPTLNPTFPTATVKGGLVVYDGATWSLFSKLFLV